MSKKRKILLSSLILILLLAIVFKSDFYNLIAYFLDLNDNFIKKPFIPKNDYLTQHVIFYEDFFRNIVQSNFGWSWNNLLGADLIATKSFYMYGDIYAYLGYFLHLFYKFTPAIMFALVIIKIIVAYFLFYTFLSFHCEKELTKLIGGVGYALSGFVLVFIEQPMFLSFYSLLPLWLISVELFFDKNKLLKVILPLSTLFIICTNPIMAFSGCWFLLIYWIVRSVQIYEHFQFKIFIQNSLKFLKFFLIGVTLSSIITLPFLKSMLQSPRLDDTTFGTLQIRDVFSYIQNQFIPLMFYYSDGHYKGIYYVSQFGVYSGLISFIFTQAWFILNYPSNKKEVITWVCPFIFLIICFFIPQIWKIFCLSQNLRWTYYLIIIKLLLSCRLIDGLRKKQIKTIQSVTIINIIAIVVILYTYRSFYNIKYSYIYIELIFALLVLLILIFIGFSKRYKIYLLMLIFIEYAYYTTLTMSFVKEDQTVINQTLFSGKESVSSTFNELKKYDSSFYRILIDNQELNYGTYLGIPNGRCYDSSYQYTLEPFYLKSGVKSKRSVTVDFMRAVNNNDSDTLNNANIKYIITSNELNSIDILSKIDLNTPLNVYAVDGETGLGKLLGNDNQDYFNPSLMTSNKINFLLNDESGIFELKIPYTSNWNVYCNGNKLNSYKSNEGFLRTDIENCKNLEFRYVCKDVYFGALLSLIGSMIWFIDLRGSNDET